MTTEVTDVVVYFMIDLIVSLFTILTCMYVLVKMAQPSCETCLRCANKGQIICQKCGHKGDLWKVYLREEIDKEGLKDILYYRREVVHGHPVYVFKCCYDCTIQYKLKNPYLEKVMKIY